MRVAIVHEWFASYAGSERVLEQMLHVLPQADLFALVDFLPAGRRGFLGGRSVRTSFLQKMPFARRGFRKYLALMPLAVEQFDLSGYDLVISNSHAVAKGVVTGPDQLHVCVCYSPMRYAWDLQHQYLAASGLQRGPKSWLVRVLLHYLRQWDARSANGVDHFVAVSRFIARRIRKTYRRDSRVIYPPVDVDAFSLRREKEGFYLAASRMAPYKRMDLIVESFARMPGRELIVIGAGPQMAKVRRAAKAARNISVLGYQPDDVLIDHMQRARAFVFAAEEDFGIMPVEAQACGTPVIALGRGGATETVLDGQTGVLFESQTTGAIIEAVEKFERFAGDFEPDTLRRNAERFGVERFRREFAEFVGSEYDAFRRYRAGK